MSRDSTKSIDFVQKCFERFHAAYQRQNFGEAYECLVQALWADAGVAFRHFVTRASGAVSGVLRHTQKAPELTEWLDALLEDHPNMHLLCDEDPDAIRRLVELRDSNISKGLPSIVLVTQGKAASVPVAGIFNWGFNLPSFAYSLVTLDVIESWARDYARGGACYSTHLGPTPDNVARFKNAGITKIIVHVRDPRQSLLSMIHHVTKFPDQLAALSQNDFHLRTITRQIDDLLPSYVNRIHWIQGWIDAEAEMNVMFSTFEDYVTDRETFIQRYLDFYDGPRECFSYENAVQQNANIDYHFRSGLIDEWRSVFPAKEAERLSAWLPDDLKRRFGWPD